MEIQKQLTLIIKDVNTYHNKEIQTCLHDEQDISDAIQIGETILILKKYVQKLINLVSNNSNIEYEELEKIVQKNEAEVRQHIRLEQQMKLYTDSLQEKIELLEREIKNLAAQNQEIKTETGLKQAVIKDLERKLLTKTRESSPQILVKKANFMINQDLHISNKGSLISQSQESRDNVQRLQQEIRRPSYTQHQQPIKNMYLSNNIFNFYKSREQRLSQHTQEKQLDKSIQIVKSQNSVATIKMYNISKLLMKNQQELGHLKSKTSSIHEEVQKKKPR